MLGITKSASGFARALPYPTVEPDIVNLSITCRYLREVFIEHVRSHLVLKLGRESGVVYHYKASTGSSHAPWPLERTSMELIPSGPHIKMLVLRILLPDSRSDPGQDGTVNQRPRGWDLWGEQLARHTKAIDEVTSISDAAAKVIPMLPRVESVFVIAHARPRGAPHFPAMSPQVTSADIGMSLTVALSKLDHLSTLQIYNTALPLSSPPLQNVIHLQLGDDFVSLPSLLTPLILPQLKDFRIYPGITVDISILKLPLAILGHLKILHWCHNEYHDTISNVEKVIQVSLQSFDFLLRC